MARTNLTQLVQRVQQSGGVQQTAPVVHSENPQTNINIRNIYGISRSNGQHVSIIGGKPEQFDLTRGLFLRTPSNTFVPLNYGEDEGLVTPVANSSAFLPAYNPEVQEEYDPTIASTYSGGLTGPNGEVLPGGALFFTKQGDPYFGERVESLTPMGFARAFVGWTQKLNYNIFGEKKEQKPIDEGIMPTLEHPAGTINAEELKIGAQNVAIMAGNIITYAGNAIHNGENSGGVTGFLTRVFSEAVGGLFNTIFVAPGQLVKRGLFAGQQIAAGEKLDTAWNASQIAGTAVAHSGVLEDYKRQYEEGKVNPVLLAHQLEDPLHEMVAEFVVDPWTWLGVGSFVKSVRGGHIAAEVAGLSKASVAARDGMAAMDAARAAKAADKAGDLGAATVRVLEVVDKEKAPILERLTALAREAGARAHLSSAKQGLVSDVVRGVFGTVVKSNPDMHPQEIAELAADLAKVVRSDNAAERALALQHIVANPAREVLLSPAGYEAGDILADMMFAGGKFSPRGFGRIEQAAVAIAKLDQKKRAAAWANEFARWADDVAKDRFPSILERVENQAVIKKLLAAGTKVEDLPTGLKRFVGDELPDYAIRLAKYHKEAQKVIGPINRILGMVFIRGNPAVWARNFGMDGAIATIDDPLSLAHMSTARNAEALEDWLGAPSRLQAGGFGGVLSAVPGQEIEAAPKNKNIWTWLTTRMEAVERSTALRVTRTATEECMKSGIKGILRSVTPRLRESGQFSADDIRRLERLLYQNRGNWGATVKAYGGTSEHLRVLASIPDEAHEFLINYHLMDDVRAATLIVDPSERARALGAVRAKFEALVQRGLKSYDRNMLSQLLGDQEAMDLIEHLPRAERDLFATKAAVNSAVLKQVDRGVANAFKAAQIASKDNPKALQAIEKLKNTWARSVAGLDMTYGKARDALRAEAVAKAAEAPTKEIKNLIWEEYLMSAEEAKGHKFLYLTSPGTLADGTPIPPCRDALHAIFRDFQVTTGEQALAQLEGVAPGFDRAEFDLAMEQVQNARLWDAADPRKIDDLPEAARLLGVNADGITSDSPLIMTEGQAYANAAEPGRKMLEDIFATVEARLNAPSAGISAEAQAALDAISSEIERGLAAARHTSSQYADIKRAFTLHDYVGEKRGYDAALAYIFPYQFWYSRTYAKWLTRLSKNPWVGAAYGRYRAALNDLHAGLPDWWKYTLNSNELFGLDSKNPMYFNLEQQFNSLYGLVGVDFNDAKKRKDWFPAFLDTLGKQGPSIWAPFGWAIAGYYAMKGDTETAEAWAGRVIPQTATIKAATGLLGLRGEGKIMTPLGIELDPMMWFQGGMGKFERRAIGRMIARMVSSKEISEVDGNDAAYAQSGPIWDRAAQLVVQERGPSQITGQFAGWGFKFRRPEDAAVDKFYNEMFALMERSSLLSPQEYSQAWQDLRERFPFSETVLLSRKSTEERDSALAWNVINRVPPGQTRDYAELVGMDYRILDRFYSDKGDMSKWEESDRERLMAGILDLGTVLNVPEKATRHEWIMAKNTYTSMNDEAKRVFGSDILGTVDGYYDKKDDRDAANAYLNLHPEVSQYLDWKAQIILSNPLLSKYYGGLNFYESFLNSQMYAEAEEKFGEDIYETQSIYGDIKKENGDYAGYLKDHPELKEFWNYIDAQKIEISKALLAFGDKLPETPTATIRPNVDARSIGAQDVLKGMNEASPETSEATIRHSAEVLAYTSQPSGPKWSLTGYIEQQGNGRWPGVVEQNDEYEKLLASSPSQAAQYLASHPNVLQFREWEKAYRKNYNRMATYGPEANRLTEEQLQIAPLPIEAQRLVEDMAAGDELPDSIREYLASLGFTIQ